MKGRVPSIGVLGHFADANLGDDACALAVVRNLARRRPDARFSFVCRFPAIAQERYGIPSYPVRRLSSGRTRPWERPPHVPDGDESVAMAPPMPRWKAMLAKVTPLVFAVRRLRAVGSIARTIPAEARFLWRSYRLLRGLDLLLICGSNPLFDYFGGFWGYPVAIWKWAALARLTQTRFAFVSVGAGPVVSARSGRLLSRCLRRAAYVSFRDQGSLRLMRSHGFGGSAVVCPDLAMSLPRADGVVPGTDPLRVGINPMIVHHRAFWPSGDHRAYAHYVEALAEFAAGLLDDGHEVFLYGTQKDDHVVAMEIQRLLRQVHGRPATPEFIMPDGIEALAALCSTADVLVPTRFHGAVFAMLTERPTIAICYHEKTREVLAAAGLERFAVTIEDATADWLRDAFEMLRQQRIVVASQLRSNAESARARLDQQYDEIAAFLGECALEREGMSVIGPAAPVASA